jgi:hypothetical protein
MSWRKLTECPHGRRTAWAYGCHGQSTGTHGSYLTGWVPPPSLTLDDIFVPVIMWLICSWLHFVVACWLCCLLALLLCVCSSQVRTCQKHGPGLNDAQLHVMSHVGSSIRCNFEHLMLKHLDHWQWQVVTGVVRGRTPEWHSGKNPSINVMSALTLFNSDPIFVFCGCASSTWQRCAGLCKSSRV